MLVVLRHPPAITGAVYNNGVLEISLGDVNATDAVAAKIFIGGSALDINSNDVNFVAADTGNNTPAKGYCRWFELDKLYK